MDWKGSLHKRILIDNGSHRIRIGNCYQKHPLLVWENLLGTDQQTGGLVYGEEIENNLNESQLLYLKPQVRGVVIDWDKEVMLWEQMLNDLTNFQNKTKELASYAISISYQPCIPEKVKQRILEIVFDYFGFDAFYPALSQQMIHQFSNSLYKYQYPFQMVVESSHSATYCVPFFQNQPINYAIKRVDIGGQLITNYMKEIIAIRYLDIKNELRLANQIKESTGYLSLNFKEEIKHKDLIPNQYFVLPDYQTGKKGYACDYIDQSVNLQYLNLRQERISGPELIFNPSDIGLLQGGITQSIQNSIECLNKDIQNYFYENIFLSGGNTHFPNFKERVFNDIRENTPTFLTPKVNIYNQTYNQVYEGMRSFCSNEQFANQSIKRVDYLQFGPTSNLMKLYFV